MRPNAVGTFDRPLASFYVYEKFVWVLSGFIEMLIMIQYCITKLKTKIDVIPRSCFKYSADIIITILHLPFYAVKILYLFSCHRLLPSSVWLIIPAKNNFCIIHILLSILNFIHILVSIFFFYFDKSD